MKNFFHLCICFGLLSLTASESIAQGINVSTPANSIGSSFFENIGTSFGFSLPGGPVSGSGSRVVGLLPGGQLTPNVTFSQNGFGVAPAFGGFDPGAGATFGFGNFSRGGGGFSLGLNLSQGSTRSSFSTIPSVTVPNGGFGNFSSGAISPFVTGVVPVVGRRDNAVTRGIASGQLRPYDSSRHLREYDSSVSTTDSRVSSATEGAPSLWEIKNRKKEAEDVQKSTFRKHVANAQTNVDSGDLQAARSQILKAMRVTEDPQRKRQLKAWLKKLRR